MRSIPHRFLAAAAATGLAVALTACNTDPYARDPVDAVPAGNENSDLAVTAPAAGDTVAVPFEVTVAAGVELGEVEDELHHVHIWFGPDQEETLSMHFADTAQVEEAPEGETTMWVQLANAEHEVVGEPVEVTLTVEAGEAEDDDAGEDEDAEDDAGEEEDTGQEDDTGGDDDGGGYDY